MKPKIKKTISIAFLLIFVQVFTSCIKQDNSSERISSIAKYCDTNLVIDGKMEPIWLNHFPMYLRNYNLGESFVKDSSDLSAECRMTWDENNLYLFIEIFDDIIFDLEKFIYQIDIPEYYNCDCVEIFFAADCNTKSEIGTFNIDEGDSQFAFMFNSNEIIRSTGISSEIEWAKSDKTYGYNYEIKIPFETLSIDPAKNQEFGFEISINDNDQNVNLPYYNFENRSVVSWSQKTGSGANAWQNTGVFGTIKLIK